MIGLVVLVFEAFTFPRKIRVKLSAVIRYEELSGVEKTPMRHSKQVRFEATTDGMALMAAYVAGLVKNDVEFTMNEESANWFIVTLTGGY